MLLALCKLQDMVQESFPASFVICTWRALCDGFQVGADAFLQLALPALALPDVRMVYSRAATSKYLCYTDIYNQVSMHSGTVKCLLILHCTILCPQNQGCCGILSAFGSTASC